MKTTLPVLLMMLTLLAPAVHGQNASQEAPPSANPYGKPPGEAPPVVKSEAPARAGDLMGFFAAMQTLKNAQIKANWTGGAPVVEGISADLGAGHFDLSGKVDFSNREGPQTIKGRLTNIDLAALAELFGYTYEADVKGTIDADFDVHWKGLTSDEFRRTLNGVGALDLKNGDIRNWKALNKLAQKSGVEQLRSLERVQGAADLVAENGTLRVKDAQLVSNEAEAQLHGGIRLRDDRMKFTLDLALDRQTMASSKRDEVRLLAGALGGDNSLVRLPGPFIFEGDAHDPDVKFEFRDEQIQQAVPLAASYLDAKIAEEERKGGPDKKDKKKDKKLKALKELQKALKR